MFRIGIDAGGTFTDFVVLDNEKVSIFKLPSTPEKPERALLDGLARIVGNREGFLLQHGSTVGTNALLQRKGARTLLLTNQGFEDVLEIGRQSRPELYSLSGSRPAPLVPAKYRVGVKERTLWDGTVLVPLEQKSLDWIRNRVEQLAPESIAVVLLYSFVNPENELRIAKALQSTTRPVSLSHEIHPEFREYERTSATVINAYLRPTMSAYLTGLGSDPLVQRGRLTVMQSNGGTISAEAAAAQPIRTLYSGPAGGVAGAFQLAREAGYERIISFDMGGTSTDVCLCDGAIATTTEAMIDHHAIPIPIIGIHSVGAGGGSIAWLDSGGLIRVGPQSAGADPGPVCYGKGERITVTDANLYLGILDPDWFLGGDFKLSPELLRPAFEKLAAELQQVSGRTWELTEVAQGIRRIVNTQMEGAIRVISLEKGYDTREFTLVSFGGAGGLHACDLARALLIPRVVVPANPGVLSALGILGADVVKDTSLTLLLDCRDDRLQPRLDEAFQPLQEKILEQLRNEGFSDDDIRLKMSLDARYVGQSFELNVPYSADFLESFHRRHQQFYGYSNPSLPVEIVTIRASGSGRFPAAERPRFPFESENPPAEAIVQERQVLLRGEFHPTSFYVRNRLRPGNRLRGPAVILEYSATTLVPPDFHARLDEWLNLVIEPVKDSRPAQ